MYADHGMTRAALVVNDLGIGRSGCAASSRLTASFCAPPPPWPLRLAYGVQLAKLLIVPDRRLRRLDQHGAQKDVALFENGPPAGATSELRSLGIRPR